MRLVRQRRKGAFVYRQLLFGQETQAMLKRSLFLALVALLVAGNSGCCLFNCVRCLNRKICAKAYCCDQCGERYWSEWFNDPPECCDPCNDCGAYTGDRACCKGLVRREQRHNWGQPNCGSCCEPSCTNCGQAGCGSHDMPMDY